LQTKEEIKDVVKSVDVNGKEFVKIDSSKSKDSSNVAGIKEKQKKSDSLAYKFIDSANTKSTIIAEKLKGKRITILITGVDSRLGTTSKHADANHLLKIWLDEGKIEIISIPRGTPADAGFEPNDTIDYNYLANVRANRGRNIYFDEICRIADVKKIDYYVEFGFSQALGLIELLGYKNNAVQMLRMLRSRKGFGIGDYQRVYNQGQFIRQMLLKMFPIVSGGAGNLILQGGLYLVETNLSYSIVNQIIDRLKEKGFPKNENDVLLHVKPKMNTDFLKYDFANKSSRDSLYTIVQKTTEKNQKNKKPVKEENISNNVAGKLREAINSVQADTLKNPKKIISKLSIFFEQRAWYQVSDSSQRNKIRKDICTLLSKAYQSTKNPGQAKYIQQLNETEEKLLNR
ncbi:MAG: hypothetical protein ABSG15_11095, partial [FCB group bacterium]